MTSLTLSATVEYDSVEYNAKQDLYVMSSIKAPFAQNEERESRASIDIVCVIDVSFSMMGQKIDLVKQTLLFMIEQLKEEDRLSLVEFSSDVSTKFAFQTMSKSGKEQARHVVKALDADGGTFLSGGLFGGLDELNKRTNPRDVSALLIFTDGQASEGICDFDEMVAATESRAKQLTKPVSVFSFGFGEDHDANMIRGISEAGNGLYYYIQHEAEIPQSFADCLGGLLSVSAQNIKIKIEPCDGVSLKAIHSAYKKTTDTSQCVELSIGDLYSEEQKDIILEVTLDTLSQVRERQEIVKFTLYYLNVVSMESDELEAHAVVNRPSAIPTNRQVSLALDKQRNRVETANTLKQSRELADSGKLQDAQHLLQNLQAKMEKSPSAQDSLVLSLQNDVKEVIRGMNNRDTYFSMGSKVVNSHWASHQQQRSNRATPQMNTEITATPQMKKGTTASPYFTSAKTRMQTSAYTSIQPSTNLDFPLVGRLLTLDQVLAMDQVHPPVERDFTLDQEHPPVEHEPPVEREHDFTPKKPKRRSFLSNLLGRKNHYDPK
jgi:Mg-chelatase subunit ChlD